MEMSLDPGRRGAGSEEVAEKRGEKSGGPRRRRRADAVPAAASSIGTR